MKITGMHDIDTRLYKEFHMMKVREDFNAWSGGILFEDPRTKDRLAIWHVYGIWHYKFMMRVCDMYFDSGCEPELRKLAKARIMRMKRVIVNPITPDMVDAMFIQAKKEAGLEDEVA